MKKIQIITLIIIVIILVGFVFIYNFYPKNSNVKSIQQDVSLVRKDGNNLILKLDNGQEKILTDDLLQENNRDNGCNACYDFDKLYEDINIYGINIYLYEGIRYSLVNKNNGEEIDTISKKIIISSDKKRIVSYDLDLEMGDTNGFEIINIENNQLKSEIKVNPLEKRPQEIWGPSKITWLSDSEIEVEKSVMDYSKIPVNESPTGVKYPDDYLQKIGIIKYKLINGSWVEEK
ncbi:MAG: hypothetical protein WC662_02345 [Candidatus Paceibacterota bacterium]|jgi:hypothetical protein